MVAPASWFGHSSFSLSHLYCFRRVYPRGAQSRLKRARKRLCTPVTIFSSTQTGDLTLPSNYIEHSLLLRPPIACKSAGQEIICIFNFYLFRYQLSSKEETKDFVILVHVHTLMHAYIYYVHMLHT